MRQIAVLHSSHWHRVGLLIDYYQYPKGAPGRPHRRRPGRIDVRQNDMRPSAPRGPSRDPRDHADPSETHSPRKPQCHSDGHPTPDPTHAVAPSLAR